MSNARSRLGGETAECEGKLEAVGDRGQFVFAAPGSKDITCDEVEMRRRDMKMGCKTRR